MGTLEKLYAQYREVTQFFVVYIKEAHSRQGWPVPVDRETGEYIDDPVTFDQRESTARTCMLRLDLSLPCLIDDMENSTARAYRAHPDRIYLVGRDGRILYAGGPGPFEFKPKQLKPYLEEIAEAAGTGEPGRA